MGGSAPMAPRSPGPVSAALEADLRRWVQRHGLIVWLDPGEHYGAFVDHLVEARAADDLPYDVRAFRGSYLELMLGLEDAAAGVDPPRLVIHLPGFNEETVRETPLLELYRAGVRYRKGLETLVTEAGTGRVRQEEIAGFLQGEELSLEAADAWLARLLADRQGGLSAELRVLSPEQLLDNLLKGGSVAERLSVAADAEIVWQHLAAVLGLADGWRAGFARAAASPTAEEVAFAAASWALSVEYVHDLRRPPVASRLVGVEKLPAAIGEACHSLAAHLRDRHPGFYQRTADETQILIDEEQRAARAEDLGRIDTFRFEEHKVLDASIASLEAGDWATAREFAKVRMKADDGGTSFWLRHDVSRHSAWELVAAAAELGLAIDTAGARLAAKDHHAAVERYANAGAPVDRAHRQLEQLWLKHRDPQLPHFEALRARIQAMRQVWRAWADEWARDFNELCLREGFLPAKELQQRLIFDEVVRASADEGTTAFFVVDAFRFEMGAQLEAAIGDTPATTPQLHGRLAELPTNTEVGMNVLAPVADATGKLSPALRAEKFVGFSTGEYRVKDPGTRQRAMRTRVGGDTLPWLSLAEVLSRDATSLKKAVAQAKLLVVHSEEIDKAGEKGIGIGVFDTVMQQLRSAWQLLREAGVKRFVFTADHGFLLLEGTTDAAQHHGRKIDPKRRHVLTRHGVDRAGEVRVGLSDLAYVGADDADLIFPETTLPFDTGKRKRTFVHGGNSLQERVIPVLTVVHRAAAGGSTLRYRVTATAKPGVAGMHCLVGKVKVSAGQASLDFGAVREVELAMRVLDLPDVSPELCQVRAGGRLEGGVLVVRVGEPFELFFRLQGQTDARARVELHHPSRALHLEPGGPETRFAVAAAIRPPTEPPPSGEHTPAAPPPSEPPTGESWLQKLPDDGTREVFAHIEVHGSCHADVAAKMLGGQRQLRRFSRRFEGHVALAPFDARIEIVGGVKCYVKEGPS